ncbi:MAG: rhamnogalacturonan acetylesterase [Prevotella sp.]|nr:rhamnogalacturonan acetylesterase [Prevotella sp.]
MKKIFLAAVALLLMTASTQQHVTTIFVIGDSTAARKDLSKGSPERGWGMALGCYFDDAFIRVDDHALNGRSSKSFIGEGHWDKVLKLIKPGDYVIIQFGHNDEKPGEKRHTDPGSTFDYTLAKYVRETREHGGIPVIMNPVVRRNYTLTLPQGDDEALRNTTYKDAPKKIEGDTLVDTHGLYRTAPRDVAQRMNCYFIDANRITHDLETSLGKEGSKRLHMWYKPGEHPALPDGRQDNTHYNIWGAHQVAKLLADALCEEIPMLSKFRTDDNPCRMEQP